jgi:hypothetical protein
VVEKGLHGGGGLGRPRRALAALALSLLAAGCYSYTEVSPAAVPPGSYVRVSVDPGAIVQVGGMPLQDGTRTLRGRLMEGSSNETLLFSVPLVGVDPRLADRGLRSTVSVPVADVRRAELRRLDKGRTGALIGGGGVVALLLTRWAFNVLDPAGDDGPPGPPANNARWVLFRLRW